MYVFTWLFQCNCVSTFRPLADKYAKDPLAMQCYLMYANCVERGHQLELVVCTCRALIHEVGKPANCMCQRHPSWVLSTRLI